MAEEILKIENVSKKYRLGMIGGTSLKEELQRKRALRKGLEDPTRLVTDTSTGHFGEEFLALDGITFTVHKGERVGIIGHNGAGKSTLLKLISRITAPTTGTIEMNGRVASMLEVGTGFHPELSGRENIYMNGAILGMNKEEIDSKIEDIIEFSEVRQFIDTPVKRYSSGMFVKLAFSVAAHLDSEIMIMDEVLAVGDMAFQRKCLEKMTQVSETEQRTILYVSHNMNTIRQLCERVVVLDHGRVIYDGDVETAINIYLGRETTFTNEIIVNDDIREIPVNNDLSIERIRVKSETGILDFGDNLGFSLDIKNHNETAVEFLIRIILKNSSGNVVTMSAADNKLLLAANEEHTYDIIFNMNNVVPGNYTFTFVLYEVGEMNIDRNIDVLRDIASITVKASPSFNHGMAWNSSWWGNFTNGALEITDAG